MSLHRAAAAAGHTILIEPATVHAIRTLYAAGTTNPPDQTIIIQGVVPDIAAPFATGSPDFADLFHVSDGSGNDGIRIRMSPSGNAGAGELQVRWENNNGVARLAYILLPSGTRGDLLRGQRFTLVCVLSARTPTTYLIYGTGSGTTLTSAAATALSANFGLRAGVNVRIGEKATGNRAWPGDIDLIAITDTVLSQANAEAIHAANDTGWTLHTYRSVAEFHTASIMAGEPASDGTYPITDEAVTDANLFGYDAKSHRKVTLSFTDGSYNNGTKTLTKTGAFAGYTFASGDRIQITAGTGVTPSDYEIASRTSDDAIVTVLDIGGTNPTNVAATEILREDDPGWFDTFETFAVAAPVTVTGTWTYSKPKDHGYTANESIVPTGGSDMTVVQNATSNPALAAFRDNDYDHPTHFFEPFNSRGVRSATDPENEQTQNVSYDPSQPSSIQQNYVSGIGALDPDKIVGFFRHPTLSASAGHFCAWNGAPPSTGTVTLISGNTTNSPMVDFARFTWASQVSTGGPGQVVAISASSGVDILFSLSGALGVGSRIRVWACLLKYPGSATASRQKVSHTASGATTPFGDAATNYAAGATHGSVLGPTTLSTSTAFATGDVDAHNAGARTITDSVATGAPFISPGMAIVVDRGGSPCIGIIESEDFSANPSCTWTMERSMGTGTGIPTAGDDFQCGGIDYEWVYVDFDGSESPDEWRGIRLTTGGSGFPAILLHIGVQLLSAADTPAPGAILWPAGHSGNGYANVDARVFHTARIGGSGETVFERWLQKMRETMRVGGGILSANLGPAQQGSVPDDMKDFYNYLDNAGFEAAEQSFVTDNTHAANTNTMATQNYSAWAAFGLTECPTRGIVGINIWPQQGVPFTQVVNGEAADTAHKSTDGVKEHARLRRIAYQTAVTDGDPGDPDDGVLVGAGRSISAGACLRTGRLARPAGLP